MLEPEPARPVVTEGQKEILRRSRYLSQRIYNRVKAETVTDDVLLLVADLLDAHADTGIELGTWPSALDVVTDHLSADPEGRGILAREHMHTWFTIVGIWVDRRREPVAIIPGRRRLDVALGCWSWQVKAASVAEAVAALRRHDEREHFDWHSE